MSAKRLYDVGDGRMLSLAQIAAEAGVCAESIRKRVVAGVRGADLLHSRAGVMRVMFRGKMRSISEIADMTDTRERDIRNRLLHTDDIEYAVSASYGKVFNAWKDIPYSEHAEAQLAVKVAESWGGMTMQEIANIMGVSKQRVEQIERNALAKLRAKNKHLLEYLEALREREERQEA